jgi:hypothetical protein
MSSPFQIPVFFRLDNHLRPDDISFQNSNLPSRTARGRLKQLETQSGVAGREVKTKQRKHQSLERIIAKYNKEMAELRG